MTDLQICIQALIKIIFNFWPALIITIAMLIKLWRREKFEKKAMEEATKWDKLKGKYHQKHFVGSN